MANSVSITAEDIVEMVGHWLATRPYGYLGSAYGSDIKSLLQNPLSATLANAFLAKLRTDIPLIGSLPANAVDLNVTSTAPDKQNLWITIGSKTIQVGG